MILDNTQIVDQTKAIEKVPYTPSLIGSLGFFRDETVGSDAISFDVRGNSLYVLNDSLRNTRQVNTMPDQKWKMHTLAIPHYLIENTIGRNQLAGVRGFGKETEIAVNTAVADELSRQAERHDNHEEYLKSLMLFTGQVDTNYFGTIDVASEFGVVQATQTLDSGTSTIGAGIREATKKAKEGLNSGGRVRGYVLFAGAGFFEQFVAEEVIAQAYASTGSGMNPLLNELGTAGAGYTMFRFGNVDVVLYDDEFTKADGTTVKPVGDDEGVLVPRTELGSAYFGPVSKLSGIGSMGAKRFASSFRDPKDRFIEVESEQNTLVVNKNFGSTVKLTFA